MFELYIILSMREKMIINVREREREEKEEKENITWYKQKSS